ncbi:MAG: hypothetical protein Q3972_02900 [Corynebacterium sp.]|nr:hypothetical protein [Corynebacterium sp.]
MKKRALASILAGTSLLLTGLSAPQAKAMVVREADPAGCTTELDARDIALSTRIYQDHIEALADFLLFNGPALGMPISQEDRNTIVRNAVDAHIVEVNSYSGYDRLDVLRDALGKRAARDRVRPNEINVVAELADDPALANEILNGPARLGVPAAAYAVTLYTYLAAIIDIEGDGFNDAQLRILNNNLRKVDVDAAAVYWAHNLDMDRATLDGCAAVTNTNNSDISGDLAESLFALGLQPGQFYNARVIRFPFSLLPPGSSIPGM